MTTRTNDVDLRYALFSIVSDAAERRFFPVAREVPRNDQPAVIKQVRQQAEALDDDALRQLRFKLAKGFLHEIDRRISQKLHT